MGKLHNCRTLMRRVSRESDDDGMRKSLSKAADKITGSLNRVAAADSLEEVRGIEGDATRIYFGQFDSFIRHDKSDFFFRKRTRRPPLDRVNAMLSFLYAMLANDARSACESVGLDAAVGFLHRDRPGRPGLALDMMEELRPLLADRVALTVLNRRQIKPSGFRIQGA